MLYMSYKNLSFRAFESRGPLSFSGAAFNRAFREPDFCHLMGVTAWDSDLTVFRYHWRHTLAVSLCYYLFYALQCCLDTLVMSSTCRPEFCTDT